MTLWAWKSKAGQGGVRPKLLHPIMHAHQTTLLSSLPHLPACVTTAIPPQVRGRAGLQPAACAGLCGRLCIGGVGAAGEPHKGSLNVRIMCMVHAHSVVLVRLPVRACVFQRCLCLLEVACALLTIDQLRKCEHVHPQQLRVLMLHASTSMRANRGACLHACFGNRLQGELELTGHLWGNSLDFQMAGAEALRMRKHGEEYRCE